MKILHTADIHLTEYQDERWQTLERLLELGQENEVDVFAISGDLFNKDFDAENLKPEIRKLFSNTRFRVLIIPGNHDKDSYSSGMYFGAMANVLGNAPFEEYGDVRILGFPFEPVYGEELVGKIQALGNSLRDDKKNILLCHGELLDVFHFKMSRADFGDEGEGRYMPFKLSYFEGLNLDYVLAGHFHTSFDVRHLPNGGYFVYPGSPVSITKREVGQRSVNIFEVGQPPQQYLLNTPHYEQVSIELDPLAGVHPLEMVKEHLQGAHAESKVILTVSGYINSEKAKISETDLDNQIKELTTGKCADYHCDFKDIRRIVEDDLFKTFENKLLDSGCEEAKAKQMRDIGIRAMMKARR